MHNQKPLRTLKFHLTDENGTLLDYAEIHVPMDHNGEFVVRDCYKLLPVTWAELSAGSADNAR